MATSLELPEWVIQAFQSLGVAGGPVMAFFWWLEYRQRMRWQADLLERNERFINATNEMTTTLKGVTTAVEKHQEGLMAQTATVTDMAATLRILSKRSRD